MAGSNFVRSNKGSVTLSVGGAAVAYCEDAELHYEPLKDDVTVLASTKAKEFDPYGYTIAISGTTLIAAGAIAADALVDAITSGATVGYNFNTTDANAPQAMKNVSGNTNDIDNITFSVKAGKIVSNKFGLKDHLLITV